MQQQEQFDVNNLPCYVRIQFGTNNEYSIQLPCYPDELSESTNANWSEQSIVGRSFPISAYTGTGYREVSFSFTLHREMYYESSTKYGKYTIDNRDVTSINNRIDNILGILRKSVYPLYQSRGLLPPVTTFRFGDFVAKGIVKSISYSWKKPIVHNRYQLCDVSVSMSAYADKVVGASNIGLIPVNPFLQEKIGGK